MKTTTLMHILCFRSLVLFRTTITLIKPKHPVGGPVATFNPHLHEIEYLDSYSEGKYNSASLFQSIAILKLRSAKQSATLSGHCVSRSLFLHWDFKAIINRVLCYEPNQTQDESQYDKLCIGRKKVYQKQKKKNSMTFMSG